MATFDEGGVVCLTPTYEGVVVCSVPGDKVEGAEEASLDNTEAGREGVATPNKMKTQNHHFSGGTAAGEASLDNNKHVGDETKHNEVEGAGETFAENDIHRDLSESFPWNTPNTNRESKFHKMRIKREAFKEQRKSKTCKRQQKERSWLQER